MESQQPNNQQINEQDIQQFEQLCKQSINNPNYQQKLQADQNIYNFLHNFSQNFHIVSQLVYRAKDPHIQLIIFECLSKIITSKQGFTGLPQSSADLKSPLEIFSQNQYLVSFYQYQQQEKEREKLKKQQEQIQEQNQGVNNQKLTPEKHKFQQDYKFPPVSQTQLGLLPDEIQFPITSYEIIANQLLSFLSRFLIEQGEQLQSNVLKSCLFCLSNVLRVYWFDNNQPYELISKVIFWFFKQTNDIKINILGLKTLDEILDSITTQAYYDSYLDYRKIIINFQRNALLKILNITTESFQIISQKAQQLQNQQQYSNLDQECPGLLESGQLLFKCFNYQFSLSYFDYDLDTDPKEVTIINFPSNYEYIFNQQDFILNLYRTTFKLIEIFQSFNGSLNGEQQPQSQVEQKYLNKIIDSLNAFIKCIKLVNSCKMSVFETKGMKKSFRNSTFQGISNLLMYGFKCNLQTQQLQEILEANFRLLMTYRAQSELEYDPVKDGQEGEIIANAFKFVEYINSNQLKNYERSDKLVYLGINLFMEQFFNITLDRVEVIGEMGKNEDDPNEDYDEYTTGYMSSVKYIKSEASNKIRKIISESSKYVATMKFFQEDQDYRNLVQISVIRTLSNAKIADHDIINSSFDFLRLLLLRMKRQIDRKRFQSLDFLQIIQQFVDNFMDQTVLANIKYCKYRTNLYEMIAYIWVDDYFDSYTLYSIKLAQNLQNLHFKNGINKNSIIMYCRDIIGLNNSIEIGKIFSLHFRNIYKQIEIIIEQTLNNFINDEEVTNAVLDLFLSLTPNKSQRLTIQSNNVATLQIYDLFSSFSNKYLQHISNQIVIRDTQNNNFEDYSKGVYKLWKNYLEIFSGNYIHMQAFQFFGQNSAVEFLKNMIYFISYVQDVVSLFPKYEETYQEIIQIVTETQISFLLASSDNETIMKFFKIQYNILQSKFKQYYISNNQEPNMIIRATNSFLLIYQTILEELCISYDENIKNKYKQFLASTEQELKQVVDLLLEIVISLQKNKQRMFTTASKLLFILYVIDQRYLDFLRAFLIQKFSKQENIIVDGLKQIINEIEISYNLTVEDKFSSLLKQLLKTFDEVI